MNGLNILRKSIRLNLLPFSLMQLQEVCMKQPFNSTIHGAGWEVPMESLNITTWMAITLTSKFPLLVIRFFLNTKLSLVVFNKDNKNFAGIQQQVQNWIKENCKSYKQWNSNIWDCVKYREDTGRDVRLAIALYDVSIKELPSSKKN